MRWTAPIRASWRKLSAGEAGRRFTDFYEDRRKRRASAGATVRVAWVGLGIVLVLGGLAIGWLPGPGGFIAIFGAALLATEYRPLARLLDRAESVARRTWRWIRTRWKRSSTAAKIIAVAAMTSFAVILVYAAASLAFG
jgi:hypothetical protein